MLTPCCEKAALYRQCGYRSSKSWPGIRRPTVVSRAVLYECIAGSAAEWWRTSPYSSTKLYTTPVVRHAYGNLHHQHQIVENLTRAIVEHRLLPGTVGRAKAGGITLGLAHAGAPGLVPTVAKPAHQAGASAASPWPRPRWLRRAGYSPCAVCWRPRWCAPSWPQSTPAKIRSLRQHVAAEKAIRSADVGQAAPSCWATFTSHGRASMGNEVLAQLLGELIHAAP